MAWEKVAKPYFVFGQAYVNVWRYFCTFCTYFTADPLSTDYVLVVQTGC